MTILIVGAGLTGAVIARQMAEAGRAVRVIDTRPYIGGNCYTERDTATGVMVHVHGPHIFHTDNLEVWNYVQRFGKFVPFQTKMKATTGGRVFSLPINLLTINQFFGKTFSPKQAEEFINSQVDRSIEDPATFEEQALRTVGPDLYKAFFLQYPLKHWGIHPRKLPASVLKRLPVRFNYDDNYYHHTIQGIPVDGYTAIFERMLDHRSIDVSLNTPFNHGSEKDFEHTFYSGKIDQWFNFSCGELPYRTLDFENSVHDGDYQGCAIMSFPDDSVPFTRITEHKHFTPWETHDRTIISTEYSRLATRDDIPYYPIRLAKEDGVLSEYLAMAAKERNVSFVGRLGSYRYLDMDVAMAEALASARAYLADTSGH